ncbi:hypothetical protein ACIGNX_25975 [Actinosynnema sp. NPDC053489]
MDALVEFERGGSAQAGFSFDPGLTRTGFPEVTGTRARPCRPTPTGSTA